MKDLSRIRCGELGDHFSQLIRRRQSLVAVGIAGAIALVLLLPTLSTAGVLKILLGFIVVFKVWVGQRNLSLPIMMVIALQTLFVYGLPIITNNEMLADFSADEISRTSSEVLIFLLTLALGWKWGINHRGRAPREYIVFSFMAGKRARRLPILALGLMSINLAFEVLDQEQLLNSILALLPQGVFSIVRTLAQAAGMGGALLGGFAVGSRSLHGVGRIGFWVMFWSVFSLHIISYLLSSATGLMCSASLGLLIGRRRPPIAFLVLLATVCSFFNLTKFEMRQKYWDQDLGYAVQPVAVMPERFGEWISLSTSALFTPQKFKEERNADQQRLSDRVNNLVNLLYVYRAVQQEHIPTLGGATYILVPKLLIPRVFWPDKPRAHEGQVLLNVHFGRQTLAETLRTYVAWGLIAEAYGNFGSWVGAIVLALTLGYTTGRVENWIRPFPIGSLQSFVTLAFMVQVGTSFEMVSSVFVTSTFQLIIAIIAASWMLVERRPISELNERETPPTEDAETESQAPFASSEN